VAIPAIGQVKKIDFFINQTPFDLKVTYLPEGYTSDYRRAAKLRPELTVLKGVARQSDIRQDGRNKAYQLRLFSPEARTNISFEEGFKFSKDMYFDVRKHRGGAFRFRNHFLGADNVPAFSGSEGDGGEEFICAQMLDSLNDKVEFWIRNVVNTSTHSDCRWRPDSSIQISSRN
jgi:hypothetical protein